MRDVYVSAGRAGERERERERERKEGKSRARVCVCACALIEILCFTIPPCFEHAKRSFSLADSRCIGSSHRVLRSASHYQDY